jgi:hypothetical protein
MFTSTTPRKGEDALLSLIRRLWLGKPNWKRTLYMSIQPLSSNKHLYSMAYLNLETLLGH